jgi:phosphoglucosamine mutase
MARIEGELAGTGRLLVRYSGTEKKCRVMIEGDREDRIGELARDLVDIIGKELGQP